MKDAAKRALRTFVQAFLAIFTIVAVPWANNIVTSIINAKPYELDFSILQSAAIAGALAAGVALLSWIQNEFEDKTHTTVLPK